MKLLISYCAFLVLSINIFSQDMTNQKEMKDIDKILKTVRDHSFNPLAKNNTMTFDRDMNVAGVADLDNRDWRVRMLAVRDLVRAGAEHADEIAAGLSDNSPFVRQISAMALGIIDAKSVVPQLEETVKNDDNAIVRSQAVIALGQLESESSLELLLNRLKDDPAADVRHQCELAIDQIEKKKGVSKENRQAWINLDESLFETVKTGMIAPDFTLKDTQGKKWQLSSFRGNEWVVLIWVFADWCPVCHGEFHDLMEMENECTKENIQVFTLETHDRYRSRVMVGKELDPEYWFSKTSFKEAYTNRIWWPHLVDHAGSIAAIYGADPLTFAVHSEFINRPATIIIDKSGIVRFAYYGTYWGDRPTIKQTLEMVRTRDFTFIHPNRLK
ncbi:MAG: redoxin domain-containing protein [Bacteroidales bacterium]|nr:redoxin domain-containing protein [Bacteroidales bacterium]